MGRSRVPNPANPRDAARNADGTTALMSLKRNNYINRKRADVGVDPIPLKQKSSTVETLKANHGRAYENLINEKEAIIRDQALTAELASKHDIQVPAEGDLPSYLQHTYKNALGNASKDAGVLRRNIKLMEYEKSLEAEGGIDEDEDEEKEVRTRPRKQKRQVLAATGDEDDDEDDTPFPKSKKPRTTEPVVVKEEPREEEFPRDTGNMELHGRQFSASPEGLEGVSGILDSKDSKQKTRTARKVRDAHQSDTTADERSKRNSNQRKKLELLTDLRFEYLWRLLDEDTRSKFCDATDLDADRVEPDQLALSHIEELQDPKLASWHNEMPVKDGLDASFDSKHLITKRLVSEKLFKTYRQLVKRAKVPMTDEELFDYLDHEVFTNDEMPCGIRVVFASMYTDTYGCPEEWQKPPDEPSYFQVVLEELARQYYETGASPESSILPEQANDLEALESAIDGDDQYTVDTESDRDVTPLICSSRTLAEDYDPIAQLGTADLNRRTTFTNHADSGIPSTGTLFQSDRGGAPLAFTKYAGSGKFPASTLPQSDEGSAPRTYRKHIGSPNLLGTLVQSDKGSAAPATRKFNGSKTSSASTLFQSDKGSAPSASRKFDGSETSSASTPLQSDGGSAPPAPREYDGNGTSSMSTLPQSDTGSALSASIQHDGSRIPASTFLQSDNGVPPAPREDDGGDEVSHEQGDAAVSNETSDYNMLYDKDYDFEIPELDGWI